jgi:hypothetical protein
MLDGTEAAPVGFVQIVGAGPGAADLLTMRALRALGEADVIVHDRLVPDEVLDLARRDARRIFVGKRRAEHCVPQEGINALMVELALEGLRVVRLKGGDPFVFGRGGEEAQALRDAGIPHEIIPASRPRSAARRRPASRSPTATPRACSPWSRATRATASWTSTSAPWRGRARRSPSTWE